MLVLERTATAQGAGPPQHIPAEVGSPLSGAPYDAFAFLVPTARAQAVRDVTTESVVENCRGSTRTTIAVHLPVPICHRALIGMYPFITIVGCVVPGTNITTNQFLNLSLTTTIRQQKRVIATIRKDMVRMIAEPVV